MDMDRETETTIVLDGDYSVDVYVEGEHDWDIAATDIETKIRIREQEE